MYECPFLCAGLSEKCCHNFEHMVVKFGEVERVWPRRKKHIMGMKLGDFKATCQSQFVLSTFIEK